MSGNEFDVICRPLTTMKDLKDALEQTRMMRYILMSNISYIAAQCADIDRGVYEGLSGCHETLRQGFEELRSAVQ